LALRKRTVRKALTGVIALMQGDTPTLGEFRAMHNAGFIDVTPAALEAVRVYTHPLAPAPVAKAVRAG